MLEAHFMPEAAAELAEARLWYEERLQGLGDDFVARVKAVIDLAREEPESYPLTLDDARRAPVRRFPYGVLYAVRGSRLVVFAVYHSRRDPRGWQERLAE